VQANAQINLDATQQLPSSQFMVGLTISNICSSGDQYQHLKSRRWARLPAAPAAARAVVKASPVAVMCVSSDQL
jgi:hypothetical protein